MIGRSATLLVAAIVGTAILCVGGLIGLAGGASACTPHIDPSAAASDAPTTAPVAGYDREQLTNATIIVSVGAGRGIPHRGLIIAVATALQESSLRNLGHLGDNNDHDSLGLFQQRPSQGWGTPEQIMDPVYASNKFYDKLLTIGDWEQLPLTEAAQKVQVSGFPDAYAKWEPDATALVALVASGGSWALSPDLEHCMSNCPKILSSTAPAGSSVTPSAAAGPCDWVAPVQAPIVSGFRTASRPGHDGVDLGAARGTPIRAASAGAVVVVRCNVVPASHGCDRDGSPSTPGCGWYVDLWHAGEVYTRYCHMLTRPAVVDGQVVAAGQVIGVVGSSGHSSGPHLHFEVHVGRHGAAVDPVAFMATRAPIGRP